MVSVSLNDHPDFILEKIFAELYFKEKFLCRLVCRGWNAKLEPQLAQLGETFHPIVGAYAPKKLIKNWVCKNCPNVKELTLIIKSEDTQLSPKLVRLVEHFREKKALLYLQLIELNMKLINGMQCHFILTTPHFENPFEFFEEVVQPQLEILGMTIPVHRKKDFAMELISVKFPALKTLRLELKVSIPMEINIPKIKTLGMINLTILPAKSSTITVISGGNQCNALKHDSPDLRLESIKKLALSSTDIVTGVSDIFPNLEYLSFTDNYNSEKTSFSFPAGLKTLDFTTFDHVTSLSSGETYPTIKDVIARLNKASGFQETILWIFKHMINLESLVIDRCFPGFKLAPDFNSKENFPALPSLKKVHSRTLFPLEFIKVLMTLAPNLWYISMPLDQQSKEFLNAYPGLYIEVLPTLWK
ncbi:hypothetical protein DSO57_1001657 [Entomophthora muscae]|uniref:Uncharacterized protein n=1 Tax=Entomophthora muscae TaxID=34485 RepID=A0ACC2TWP7_9FUNG|nr:hypothetical protein DSO57_1001657 [Entomophthora muscae]